MGYAFLRVWDDAVNSRRLFGVRAACSVVRLHICALFRIPVRCQECRRKGRGWRSPWGQWDEIVGAICASCFNEWRR